jgi:hypothetical protein
MSGLKQAGNNWFDTLCEPLLAQGFKQSSIDPCLFIKPNCKLVVYVDDCLLFAKSDKVLDYIISFLQSEFNLTSEGDVRAFLGVDIQRTPDGHLELGRTGLKKNKLISLCGLECESNQHITPSIKILHANATGPEREQSWNYGSIIGMLNYLSTST